MSKDRIEIFSDAVFAIIMTLLVLDLHAPEVASDATFQQYAMAMAPLLPNFVSFVISFFVISIYWINHHYFFTHISKGTVGLAWVNNVLLLWLCLLPFPTSVIGAHPTNQFPIILYSTNLLLCALSFYFLRQFAHSNHLINENLPHKEVHSIAPRQSFPAIILTALAILLTFINVYLSLFCLIIFPFMYFFPETFHFLRKKFSNH